MKYDKNILVTVFIIISLGFFLVGLVKFTNTVIFLQDAVKTEATILGFSKHRQHTLIIRFNDQKGQSHTFRSDINSNSFSQNLNNMRVSIFYNPNDPNELRFDKFTDLWFGSLFCFIFAFTFALFPIFIAVLAYYKYRRKTQLLKLGFNVQAEFTRIRKNKSLQIDGQSPWVIVCNWKDEHQNTHHNYQFISDNIWFDPAPFMHTKTLDVYINPQNPNYYYVDIRFLPKSKNIKKPLIKKNQPIVTSTIKDPIISLYSMIFFFPSTILFIIASYFSYQNYEFYQRAEIITGIVVNHVEIEYQYYPVIAYYDKNKQQQLFEEKKQVNPFLEKGTAVELLIDPQNVLDISLKSQQIQRWGVIFILGIISFFLFMVGIIPKLLLFISAERDD